MNYWFKILILSVLFVLQGCLPPIANEKMLPQEGFYLTAPSNPALVKKITINSVFVKDNAMGSVTPDNFRSALSAAMSKAGYLADGLAGKYLLDATLIKIERPFMGFTLNAKVTINYRILRAVDFVPIVDESVTIAHEIGFHQEPDADQRLSRAIAEAIGGNITHFLRILSAKKL